MKQIHYYCCDNNYHKAQFTNALFTMMRQTRRPDMPVVILCIGTDKVTGDSLGPFVGHRLQQELRALSAKTNTDICEMVRVYGTLKEPVHAVNLTDTLNTIQSELKCTGHTDCLAIVVDASLGLAHHLGCVTLANQPLCPGEGVNKKLPQVGQISITGIIGEARSSSYKSQMALRHARLYDLVQLVDFIADGILTCITQLTLQLTLQHRDSVADCGRTFLLHDVNQSV